MLLEYSKELRDNVRKERLEFLEYNPAPSGLLQEIAAAHSAQSQRFIAGTVVRNILPSPLGQQKTITVPRLPNFMP